jgi:excisionase family DNA binding protein
MALRLDKQSLPDELDMAQARKALSVIKKDDAESHFVLSGSGQQVPISEKAFNLFVNVLEEMARGNAVLIIPIHAELTTQEAADLLNVSRPYLIKLLEMKEMPFHYTGRHRRIYFKDLMAYKQKVAKESLDALGQLAAEAQELGLGY